MDANKLKVLRGIGYKFHDCCGLCENAKLEQDGWGTCKLFPYDHLKHTDATRYASIHAYGSCEHFKPSLTNHGALTRFRRLVEGS